MTIELPAPVFKQHRFMEASPAQISQAVQNLYDTYPFPPEPLLDEPPPGFNWRWQWEAAYNFCTGQMPQRGDIRILDAGCGTGVSTDSLVHLNPQARVTAIDLSPGALKVAKERCQRSGATRVEFHHLSLFNVDQLPGEFDLINSVGVLHHTPDPIRGIKALASKLAPGGLMHIFVYGELGRWEIELMQKAIGMLQGDKRGDYQDGVKIGRSVFASLPETNRLVKREKERWAIENHQDECFADMYVHPQEIDYNIETLFELIDAAGLEFIGFSNPDFWNLERLLAKAPEALERAKKLDIRAQYRLIELLDPEVAHYEFFLAKPPLPIAVDWSQDEVVLSAIPHRHPCLEGWESQNVFNCDWKLIKLTDAEFAFVQACDRPQSPPLTVRDLLSADLSINDVRSLLANKLIMLKVSPL
jgi:SAM-dependent methyltransferase